MLRAAQGVFLLLIVVQVFAKSRFAIGGVGAIAADFLFVAAAAMFALALRPAV